MFEGVRAAYYAYLSNGSLRRGRFDLAFNQLSKVIRLYPNSPNAYVDRGFASQAMADYRGSIDDFSAAIRIDPQLAIAYVNRGISWKFLGEFDLAIADQLKAISLSPRLAIAHGELGVVYQCRHDFDRSIKSLNTAIALAPQDSSNFKHRGLAFFYGGNFKAGATDLGTAFDLARDPYALLFEFLACAKAGGDAKTELERRAAKLTTGQWPVAIVELYLGRLAIEAALTAATTPDEAAEAQFYLGEWHLLRKDAAAAKIAFEEARRSCPPWFVENTAATMALQRLNSSESQSD